MATQNQPEHGMFRSLKGLCGLFVITQILLSCSVITQLTPQDDTALIQNQRIDEARLELLGLAEIDSLIKLDNDWLADQFSHALRTHAESTGRLSFRKLGFKFSRQFILLEAIVDISDQYDNVISASLRGNVLLDFRPDQLEWIASFSQLQISSKDFTFEDGSYTGHVPELGLHLLDLVNTDIAKALISSGNNSLPLDTVPLGEVQVGAALPGFSTSPARHSQPLRGFLMVAGSAMLIDTSSTTVALDMTFIPNLSECPSDVTVTRAVFARDIESREPVGIADNQGPAEGVRYFFSEISGAKRPVTIIHYWFANGFPLAVEELPVGVSKRWRTWSGIGSTHGHGDRLEVLVVEKESGCILYSEFVQIAEAETTSPGTDQTRTRQFFTAYKDDFNNRTAGFSIKEDKPEIALIETRRVFIRDVLQASLANLNIDAEFDMSALSDRQFTALLRPFDATDIICEQRDCPPAPVCKIHISQCKRYKDTRDCVSCLFRNPLNNRCISEAIDPVCEASRSQQNARYDADRRDCVTRAEVSKQECDRLNIQALRSCQIESGFADSACESVKTSMKTLKPGSPLAHISAQVRTSGRLSANFSNFRIEGDLERLKLDMALISDIQIEGDINFSPGKINRPLALCIADWSTSFTSRFATTPAVKNLLSNFEESHNTLIAQWSGFGLTIDAKPSPLETTFVGDPGLLANCKIGLTVNQVEASITGDDAEFYRGHIELEIQPLPTRIHLAPASVLSGDTVHSGEARLSASHLRYDIELRR